MRCRSLVRGAVLLAAVLCGGWATGQSKPVTTRPAPTTRPKPTSGPSVWQRLNVPEKENCYAMLFDPADPKRALLGTRPGSLWESLDGGVTFTKKETAITSTINHGVNSGGIVVHPRVRGLWYFGHEKFGAFRSRDNGVTWTMINQGLPRYNDRHGICFAFDLKDDATIYYGADGGLFKSTDFGDRWVKCTKGLPVGKTGEKFGNTTVSRMATHPKTGAVYAAFYAVGVGDMAGIFRSQDHGETWECINHNFDGSIDQAASAALIKMLKGINGDRADAHLNEQYAKVLKGEQLEWGVMKGWSFDLAMSQTNPDVIFTATMSVLIRSTDAGERWQICDTVKHPRAVAISPKDANVVVASGTTQVWLSRDGGSTWADVSYNVGVTNGPTPAHTEFLTFDPAGQRVFALTNSGVWVAPLDALKP